MLYYQIVDINNINRKIDGDFCLVFDQNLSRLWFAELTSDWLNFNLFECSIYKKKCNLRAFVMFFFAKGLMSRFDPNIALAISDNTRIFLA